jgi:hypothetical protein
MSTGHVQRLHVQQSEAACTGRVDAGAVKGERVRVAPHRLPRPAQPSPALLARAPRPAAAAPNPKLVSALPSPPLPSRLTPRLAFRRLAPRPPRLLARSPTTHRLRSLMPSGTHCGGRLSDALWGLCRCISQLHSAAHFTRLRCPWGFRAIAWVGCCLGELMNWGFLNVH